MSPERVVLDTGILVSRLLKPGSLPALAVSNAIATATVIVSAALLSELTEVLTRPKFARYISAQDAAAFLEGFTALAESVSPVDPIVACRDPGDDHILSLAIAGRATHVVTGDDDLLVLDPFRGVRIVTPRMFLQR